MIPEYSNIIGGPANQTPRTKGGSFGASPIIPAAAKRAHDPREMRPRAEKIEVALLTGGGDKSYALGMASALTAHEIYVDFVGSNDLDVPELHRMPSLNFLNLRGDQRTDASPLRKAMRVLVYYLRLVRYAPIAKPKIFHILWNNKFEWLDRTLLLLYYKSLGKHIVFTAHNVNAGKRDGNDTLLNRLTLRVQYRLVDHLFVHTERMKREFQEDFGVPDSKITVIPFGINNTVPETGLTSNEAKQQLGLQTREKAVLFFGNIAPYKGLEYLIDAIALLAATNKHYRLLIIGRPKGCSAYWGEIQQQMTRSGVRQNIIERIEFVPDDETEIYFKAGDVLVLPYTHIFQSGVLFLGYNFGLPVVASDVGSLKEDILEGQTGFVCRPKDPKDLARALEDYFTSDIYLNLERRREEIRDFAGERYSWTTVGTITRNVYTKLLEGWLQTS
jgi:D-inositol-3-phosphate glycosyltransferase